MKAHRLPPKAAASGYPAGGREPHEVIAVKVSLLSIGQRGGRSKREGEDLLVDGYLRRTEQYAVAEGIRVASEAAFWAAVESASGRVAAKAMLMDGGGRQLTSVEFAGAIAGFRDRGVQHIVIGIGGADGWTAASRERADLLVSMGRMTLPHSLARLLAAEQIYRAMTILAGHPYHCGH